jgi:hypothetical protein
MPRIMAVFYLGAVVDTAQLVRVRVITGFIIITVVGSLRYTFCELRLRG